MRKNVLIFSHSYRDGFIEASNQYTQLFDDKLYDVTVMYLDGEGGEQIQNKHVAKNIIFLNSTNKDKRGLKFRIIKKLLAMQKSKQFHIVICHRYKPSYIMLWVAKFSKIERLLCVMHDMNTFKSPARKFLLALLAGKNTMIAGVSNAVRDDIKKSLTGSMKNKVITLYNAIDIDATEPLLLARSQAKQQLNIPENAFVFGILSRLVPAKDHNTLIEAFALIKPVCPNSILLIIGEGELCDTLKNQVQELGLTEDVMLTGFLPNALTLLKAFDVFVLSSIREAFGRVLIEAMVAKCPIIATNTDGIPEVLGETGMLVEKQNPQKLANAMLEFYNMRAEERDLQSKLGYERAVNTFSIQQFKKTFWGTC